MNSAPAVSDDLKGAQRPRVSHVPPAASYDAGDEAVELAAKAGLELDPWEAWVLRNSLGTREDGKWSAFEVGLDVPRQNGKGSILEARELAALFLLPEKLIIHSAHQFDTALEHLNRMENLIEGRSWLSSKVKRILRANGKEGIELKDGSRLRFRARTGGGGRGFTGDLIVLDEAMYIAESMHAALLPTLAARTVEGNPQVWYTGSAVDQWVHEHGIVFSRIRQRGHKRDPRVMWAEWSVDHDDPDTLPEHIAADPEAWAQANPGLGIRIAAEYIEAERSSLSARNFAVERLGIGDWPDPEGVHAVIPADVWRACLDEDSQPLDPVVMAFDVTPDRSYASIGIAGKRADGKDHIEVIKRDKGTGWVVDYLVSRVAKHKPSKLICDGKGPAGSLIDPLVREGVEVQPVTATEYAQGCGRFFDAADQGRLRHLGTPELSAAIRGAVKRTLADAWAWDRKSSGVDISPLVAVTLAHWGLEAGPPESEPFVEIF